MPKSHRDRARFTPVDLAEHFRNLGNYERDFPPINKTAHGNLHRTKKLIYTSAATLVTTAGTPIYPPFSGRLIWVQLGVTTAPSIGNLTCDVLLNGVSVFATLPTIPQSQAWGYRTAVDSIPHFSADNQNYLQVQITTINAAAGPLTCVFGFREYRGGRI